MTPAATEVAAGEGAVVATDSQSGLQPRCHCPRAPVPVAAARWLPLQYRPHPLADFASVSSRARIADIGAGCGIVGLLLAKKDVTAQVTLVELQPRLAELCRRNAKENGLAERVGLCSAMCAVRR